MRLETRTLFWLLRGAYGARGATGAPAGAERGLRGPSSEGEGGPRGRGPPDLVRGVSYATIVDPHAGAVKYSRRCGEVMSCDLSQAVTVSSSCCAAAGRSTGGVLGVRAELAQRVGRAPAV